MPGGQGFKSKKIISAPARVGVGAGVVREADAQRAVLDLLLEKVLFVQE